MKIISKCSTSTIRGSTTWRHRPSTRWRIRRIWFVSTAWTSARWSWRTRRCIDRFIRISFFVGSWSFFSWLIIYFRIIIDAIIWLVFILLSFFCFIGSILYLLQSLGSSFFILFTNIQKLIVNCVIGISSFWGRNKYN